MVEFTKEEKERIVARWFWTSLNPDIKTNSQEKDNIIYEKLKAWAEEPRHSPEKLDKMAGMIRRA